MSNMFSNASTSQFCNDVRRFFESTIDVPNMINVSFSSLLLVCNEVDISDEDSRTEGKHSKPMLLIGIYISVASILCILAMALDLLHGFRNKKFWFPCNYFSLNAASITVITVAMKLPVDLSTSMPYTVDQVAKVGSLAFMCTIVSNLMPSLGSMDNKSLLANVIGLSLLVITMVANIFIEIRTHVIDHSVYLFWSLYFSMAIVACIYTGMLLFLLIILISSAITIPTTKKILELKYHATSKTTLNDLNPQENPIPIVENLRQRVKRYWIMAETGNPQFVMASTPLSSASGIISVITTVIQIFMVGDLFRWHVLKFFGSVYKWSTLAIVITQSIGIVVGSIAPIFRCFTLLSFKSFANQNRTQLLVFKVEKYWTQKLCEWKECDLSFLSSSRRSRALLYNLKARILSFCIAFQKVIVVSCKIIGLIPIVVIILIINCSYYFKSMKATLFTPLTRSRSDNTNEDLRNYVLLLEDNMLLAEKTMKRISDSMNRLIQNAEKKQLNNLLKLLEESVAFAGVETFDTDQIQSIRSIDFVNGWSLPVVSLTCIAIALPNVHKHKVENLIESVGEGLLYTHLVEESLNKASEYVNIRRASVTLWHEVENKCKWLDNTLERSAYEGKTPTQIIKSFARIAEEAINELMIGTNGELMEKDNLPLKLIVANSMYRIAQTIMITYENMKLEIIEDELFARLSRMIADILAACLTNIPRVVTLRCNESAIEKREASVVAAIDLLGRTTEIIKRLETRELPNMDPDKMAFIDEWRLHLKQP